MTQAEWLLVSAGLTAYLVLYNALLYRMRPLERSAHRWTALWALCSFAYQAARFRQITAPSPAALHQGDWLCLLAGALLIPLTAMMVRDATGDRSWPWVPRVLWLSVAAIAVLHATTPLFITRQVGHYRNFAGHEVAFSVVGPLYAPVLLPLSMLAFAFGLRAIPASPALDRREKVTWVAGAFAYQLLGGNDVLLFSGVTARLLPSLPAQSLFEFGLVGFAAALTLRMARDAELAKAQLEQLVAQRTRELSDALGEAQAAARAKSAFLASVSHEVRTPLNGIVGLTELMLDDPDEPLSPALREQLLVVQRSGRTLRVIVDDILDFAKLDARRMTLQPAGFELGPALDDIGRLYQGMARMRGLTLSLETEGLPERVVGDELRLRQVLSNLVVNAVKFTERGGVRVVATARRLAAERGELVIEVTDTGVGISAAELQGLFEPFRQVKSALLRPSGGGTGLGLALCRQLLDLMGGAISVVSTPGQGSTFRVELPIEVVRWQPAAPLPPPVRVDASLAPPAPSSAGAGTPALAAPPTDARPPSPSGTVLVAEDDRVNQAVASGLLRRLGYGVRLVADGQQALAALAEGGFVAVLMDCQMPVMDGLEATRQARARGVTLPIIALTAFAGPEDRVRCLEAGMDEHLTKPLDRERLGAALAHLIAAPPLAAASA